MSFAYWMTKVAKAGDNPRGDFIKDTRWLIENGLFPAERITTGDALQTFVQLRRNACWEAVEQALPIWRDYERWLAKRQPSRRLHEA